MITAKNISTIFVSAFFSGAISLLGAQNTGTPDGEKQEKTGTYSVVGTLNEEGSARHAAALKEFLTNPRETTLSLSCGAGMFFGMHGALAGGDGRGANVSVFWHANTENPDMKLLFGGEILAFEGSAKDNGLETTVRSAELIFSVGGSYDFTNNFALGFHLGYGFIGATYMDEDKVGGGTDSSGTMSSVFSVKPYAEFMVNKNLSLYCAYRFMYMSPSIFSSLADWGDIEVASHSFELGIRYRF